MTVTTLNLVRSQVVRDFQDTRVRDVVPIMVERLARDNLENLATGKRWSRTDVRE